MGDWICNKCGHTCFLKQENTVPKPINCPSFFDKPNWREY